MDLSISDREQNGFPRVVCSIRDDPIDNDQIDGVSPALALDDSLRTRTRPSPHSYSGPVRKRHRLLQSDPEVLVEVPTGPHNSHLSNSIFGNCTSESTLSDSGKDLEGDVVLEQKCIARDVHELHPENLPDQDCPEMGAMAGNISPENLPENERATHNSEVDKMVDKVRREVLHGIWRDHNSSELGDIVDNGELPIMVHLRLCKDEDATESRLEISLSRIMD